MKSKVAVIKTNPERVLSDYERLFELAEVENAIAKDATTILKGNISWHMPFPSANTTPWQLEGTILSLKKHGYDDMVAVENNTVVTDPYKGERLLKFEPIFKHYEIPVLYNFKDPETEWEIYKPKGKTLALHKVYGDKIMIPRFFIGKNIIHLPTVKCHIYTTTTGAIKNAFGGLLNTKRHYTHSYIHETIVDLLMIQKEIHSGIFAVMDGTSAGNGPGPRTMKPKNDSNIILASADQVAIDAVAAKIMGFDPMSIKYINLAHNKGLGVGDPREIEIVGDDISDSNYHFSVGDNFASLVGDFIWFGPLKWAQRFFFHTPVVYLFVFGSFFYHDYIWYPLKGKRIWNDYLKTPWGQLFERWQPGKMQPRPPRHNT